MLCRARWHGIRALAVFTSREVCITHNSTLPHIPLFRSMGFVPGKQLNKTKHAQAQKLQRHHLPGRSPASRWEEIYSVTVFTNQTLQHQSGKAGNTATDGRQYRKYISSELDPAWIAILSQHTNHNQPYTVLQYSTTTSIAHLENKVTYCRFKNFLIILICLYNGWCMQSSALCEV